MNKELENQIESHLLEWNKHDEAFAEYSSVCNLKNKVHETILVSKYSSHHRTEDEHDTGEHPDGEGRHPLQVQRLVKLITVGKGRPQEDFVRAFSSSLV